MSKKKNVEYEQRIGELTIDLQRVRADFENYRKNVEREKEVVAMSAKAAMVMRMLPIVDDIGRAVSHEPKEIAGNDWVKGVKSLEKKLEKSLREVGVTKIDSKAGVEFNPEVHEAVLFDEGEGGKEVVAEELRAGYKLDGEVLRAAMVRVAKK